MLVTQVSALLASIPMAAALSVRSGPGGGLGHGGGQWGGHHGGDHDPDHEPQNFKFRIVTYDLTYALGKEYYEFGPETGTESGTYSLIQTETLGDSGTFEVNDDGLLVLVTPDSSPDLVAAHPGTLDLSTTPIPLTFTYPDTIHEDSLVEWKWTVDYEDYTLVLYHTASTTPCYLLLCTAGDPVYTFLAVGAVGTQYDGCVATYLPIEDEDED